MDSFERYISALSQNLGVSVEKDAYGAVLLALPQPVGAHAEDSCLLLQHLTAAGQVLLYAPAGRFAPGEGCIFALNSDTAKPELLPDEDVSGELMRLNYGFSQGITFSFDRSSGQVALNRILPDDMSEEDFLEQLNFFLMRLEEWQRIVGEWKMRKQRISPISQKHKEFTREHFMRI